MKYNLKHYVRSTLFLSLIHFYIELFTDYLINNHEDDIIDILEAYDLSLSYPVFVKYKTTFPSKLHVDRFTFLLYEKKAAKNY